MTLGVVASCAGTLVLFGLASAPARATEGGVGLYVPGLRGPKAGFVR
jgi:hypothetical protein